MADRLYPRGYGNPERRLRVPDGGSAVARSTVDRLCLAATPAFAIMALLTGFFGGGRPDIFCSAARDALPLNGMVVMYLLMSVFHSAPWLKLISPGPRHDE